MIRVSVNYEDSDVAKALESIIKHPNSAEFVKLLTPMLCSSSQAIQHFFKLMIGSKLPEVIPDGTLCYMPINQMSYSSNKDLIGNSDLCIDDNIIVSIQGFRGYHEYSTYMVEYTNILEDGTRKKDITYVSAEYLTVIDEI
jgi:hypothetical protein